MWETVTQVSTALTLIAFLVACAVVVMRIRLSAKERQLTSAPEEQRGVLIQALNDSFLVPSLAIDPKSLSAEQQYDLLLQQIRDRSKRFYVTALVVVSLAVLAGFVALASTVWDSPQPQSEPRAGGQPWSSAQPLLPEQASDPADTPAGGARHALMAATAPLQVVDDPTPLSRGEATRWWFSDGAALDGWSAYSVVLELSASFVDPAYNTPEVFRSMWPARVQLVGDSSELGSADLQQDTTAGPNEVRWRTELILPRKPGEGTLLEVRLGRRTVRLTLGEHRWSSYPMDDGPRQWHRMQGKVAIPLSAPDWPILRSARLMRGRRGGVSVIEVVVANHSAQPLTVSTVKIQAGHPSNEGTSCAIGPEGDLVTFDWEAIVRGKVDQAAWADFRGIEVQVPTRFNHTGACGSFNFAANVPVQGLIAARTVAQLLFRLEEIPASEWRLYGRTEHPRSLADWEHVTVAFEDGRGEPLTHPSELLVTK